VDFGEVFGDNPFDILLYISRAISFLKNNSHGDVHDLRDGPHGRKHMSNRHKSGTSRILIWVKRVLHQLHQFWTGWHIIRIGDNRPDSPPTIPKRLNAEPSYTRDSADPF